MKKTITLSGKTLNLRFGALCWEGVVASAETGTSPSRAMANLIYSAILNDDEFTKANQEVDFNQVHELVDTGLMIKGEAIQLAECEAIFQDSVKYKELMAYVAVEEEEDKKKEPRKK